MLALAISIATALDHDRELELANVTVFNACHMAVHVGPVPAGAICKF